MPFAVNSAFTWPKPAAGQEITITWSFADLDSVDKALATGGSGAFVTPSGQGTFFTGYPDFTATMHDPTVEAIVKGAFSAWDGVSGVKFVQVQDSVNAEIRIGVFGTGGALTNSGESSFGHIDVWQGRDFHKVAIEINPAAFETADRLSNIVLHEIGHALGLDDTSGMFTSNASDIMNPTKLTTQLSVDDIRGIQSLYGPQPTTTTPTQPNPAPDYIMQVARLYEAGLDRKFDSNGLNFWIDQREAGASLNSMASSFLHGTEFTARFGNVDAMSNADFVTRMYENVLDRAPDASGTTFWTNTMSGGMSREQVLVSFSDSAENQAHSTYLAGLHETQPGFWDIS